MATLPPEQPSRIALYGPFGWGNLGDAAIQESMLANARLRVAGAEFFAVSLNPENTLAIHGLPSLPIERGWRPRSEAPRSTTVAPEGARPASDPSPEPRPSWAGRAKALVRALPGTGPLVEFSRELRFFAANVRALRGTDLFVVSGGGQLEDSWGGPWHHPYRMLHWVAAARRAGARVEVVSVGAGPIEHGLSRTLILAMLRLAHGRSYRDDGSHRLLASSGFTREDPVVADLAFGHPAGEAPPDPPSTNGKRAVVGISPLCYHHPRPGPWPRQDEARYRRYLGTVEEVTAGMVEAGHPVRLFCTQIRNDRYAADDLVAALQERGLAPDGERLAFEPTTGLDHVLEQIAGVDVVVTSRLHGVILSYLLHRPVIALSYDPKIEAVMERFGQSEYCLDIDGARPALIRGRLQRMLTNLPSLREHIARTAMRERARLDAQFDRLFGPGPAPRTVVESPSVPDESVGTARASEEEVEGR